MDKSHKVERICNECGHRDILFMSKRDAAFELVNIDDVYGRKCGNCDATTFNTFYERPELDDDLLLEWATSPDLYLMEQDEELLLAEETYVDPILVILDTILITDHKRNLLIDALCVIIYDNTIPDNDNCNYDLVNKVIKALKLRIDKLRLANDWIMPYIKAQVYPHLGLDDNLIEIN